VRASEISQSNKNHKWGGDPKNKVQCVPFFFLKRSAIFHEDSQNNFCRCLLRQLPKPQDAGTPSNSTRRTCHLSGRTIRSQLYLTSAVKWVPTGMYNVQDAALYPWRDSRVLAEGINSIDAPVVRANIYVNNRCRQMGFGFFRSSLSSCVTLNRQH
jgi:hypothetical protein